MSNFMKKSKSWWYSWATGKTVILMLLTVFALSSHGMTYARNLAHLQLMIVLVDPSAYGGVALQQTELSLRQTGSWRNHGLLLDTVGQDEQARLSYAEQLKQRSDLLASYFLSANQFAAGDVEQAIQTSQQVDSHQIGLALCQKLEQVMDSRDREQINTLANQLILVAPDSFQAQYCAGRGYAATGQRLLAIATFEEAIRIGTTDSRSLLNLYRQKGDIHMGALEWEAAVAAFREAVALAPDNAAIRANLGLALTRAGDYSLAEQELLEAIAIDPQSIRPYQRLGNLYQQQGDHDQAAYWFNQARDADPNSSIPLRELGVLSLHSQDNPAQAQQYFQQAVELEPNLRANWFWLGRAHTSLGQSDDMEIAFRQAFALSETTSQKVEVLTELAQGFGRSDQTDRALPVWQEIIALDPENNQAQEAINRLQESP